MFNSDEISVISSDSDIVDSIESANVPVITVAEVKKNRQVNLETVVKTLQSISPEVLRDTKPSVIISLVEEMNRISSEYKNIFQILTTNGN